MARLTKAEKEHILADYHTGQFSIRALAIKHTIGKTTIANLVKDIKPKNKDNVDILVAVHTELSEQSGQEVDSVKQIVDKKTEHLKLINDNATLLAGKIKTLAENPKNTSYDVKTLVDANDKLAITLKVADRHAPKIDVTQMQQNNTSQATTVNIIEDKVVNDG